MKKSKTKKTTAIVKKEPDVLVTREETGNVPANMISLAISQGADLAQIEKLIELQERYEKNEARKAYHVAMANFKANAPETIQKDKKVSYTTRAGDTVTYNHATLSNIVQAITKGLSENGLSVSWPMTQTDNSITITCTITHAKGHSERFPMAGPADNSGGKNAIQALGSTVSYLERYTLLMATGLATHDQDDDGKSTEPVYITEENQHEIADLMINADAKESKVLKYAKADSLDKILKSDYPKVILALDEMVKKNKKAGGK